MRPIDSDALLKKTINNPLHVPYITKKDVIDMPSALNNQVNLCDSCTYTYPECPSEKDDVIFGNGIGNDNICACNKYQPTVQPVATDTNVGDKISKFIDGLEETFAYIREREGGDSVCGLCEYDGAYIGESGDWCNECPGFNRDDCFKLSDETRKKWTDEIIKALPTVQPEPHWIPVSERLPEDLSEVNVTWVNHNPELYYESTKDKPFTATAVYYKNEWYWYSATCVDYLEEYGRCDWNKIDEAIEIIAWMPLPEPYKPNK